MKEDIIKVDSSEIVCCFDVNGKKYCALVDNENDEDVYFALRTKIDENNSVLTSVPDSEIDAVINEYDKLVDFFESEDELDFEEEDL